VVALSWNPAVVREGGEMEVIVWANGLGERCEDFSSFLALLCDMLANDVADRRELRGSA
jgi:hypothetical protein